MNEQNQEWEGARVENLKLALELCKSELRQANIALVLGALATMGIIIFLLWLPGNVGARNIELQQKVNQLEIERNVLIEAKSCK